MSKRTFHFIAITLFVLLLIGSGYGQLHLKKMPQLIMIGCALLTCIFYWIKKNSIAIFGLYLLMAIMGYLSFTSLMQPILDWFFPKNTPPAGEMYCFPSYDLNYVYYAATVLTLLTLLVFYALLKKMGSSGKWAAILFLLSTAIIFIFTELI